jgi:iron complex transport system permease protein
MRQSGKVIVAVGVFVFMVVLSLSIGDVDDLFCKLLRIGEKRFSHTDLIILFELRVPRVLMAIGVGAMLSMSGVIMQSLFRNPLVEPYTMGLSGGAVLGVAMAFVFGLSNSMGNIAVTLMAMVGALSTMGLILLLRKMMHFDINRMLLSGVMISFATSSVTTLLMSLTTRENLSQILMWNIGS